jgi:phosphoribosylaminoimidazolecarboxamide formyltransferase/IMP cyclohydrolase
MNGQKKIKSALISVFDKNGLDEIVEILDTLGITIYSTGGTQRYIEERGVSVIPVENLTTYPSILGGRVKTLHPKVFGGILGRRELEEDVVQLEEYEIPELDLVIVDLYPFEDTVASGAVHNDIIEKIDIGGISLIRAAAKNYKDVVIVPSKNEYAYLVNMLKENSGQSSIEQRQFLAASAFSVSSNYDSQIFSYFNDQGGNEIPSLRMSVDGGQALRYGENPHQQGRFHGDLGELFDKLHGKELSYNNLLDVDAAVQLMSEFNDRPTFAILKHNNACGIASRDTILEAYNAALQGDPVSAFGGILISNKNIDAPTAEEINKLFCEVVIAPSYDDDALEILKSKKNRIILIQKECVMPAKTYRSSLNGFLEQDRDMSMEGQSDFELKTSQNANEQQLADLEFAVKLVKHTKSNTITFVKDQQLCASGTGQTSRVDACRQAIEKAGAMGFSLEGAVMASDAFFPFPDCVELADQAGIKAVVQPGGSIKDQLSIDYCNEHQLAMYFTGIRHFRH